MFLVWVVLVGFGFACFGFLVGFGGSLILVFRLWFGVGSVGF